MHQIGLRLLLQVLHISSQPLMAVSEVVLHAHNTTLVRTAMHETELRYHLQVLHINIQPLLAVGGVSGLAIGFGAQSVLANAITGISLVRAAESQCPAILSGSGHCAGGAACYSALCHLLWLSVYGSAYKQNFYSYKGVSLGRLTGTLWALGTYRTVWCHCPRRSINPQVCLVALRCSPSELGWQGPALTWLVLVF